MATFDPTKPNPNAGGGSSSSSSGGTGYRTPVYGSVPSSSNTSGNSPYDDDAFTNLERRYLAGEFANDEEYRQAYDATYNGVVRAPGSQRVNPV